MSTRGPESQILLAVALGKDGTADAPLNQKTSRSETLEAMAKR